MQGRIGPSVWCGHTINRGAWIDTMFEAGLHSDFDTVRAAGEAAVVDWYSAGELNLGSVELAWLSVSPSRPRRMDSDSLFLKVVQSGSLVIEQNDQIHRFDAGSMLIVDPSYGFKDIYGDATQVAILEMPRSALKERGLRYSFHQPFVANLASDDIRAVRELMVNTTQCSRVTSASLRARLAQQCLDLLDLVLDDARGPVRECANAALVLRTKQIVLRLLADPALSVARIAAELNISTSYLTRTMRSKGLSPMRYAWSLRLEHAAGMLTQATKKNLQAKEVAYRCGFADAAHFSRAFKAKYGLSPRAFALQENGTGGA